ncbi:MAG TPA: DUF554 domain-containing protein [Candidatus Limiplasma sp.]|nr:DUF554 domain-containing protein [Candidatus Limiplasma sp.]
MIGTLVNVAAIVAGTVLGVLLKRGISEKAQTVVMQGIGLCVLVIGIMGAITTEIPLLLVISVSLGGFLGTVIGIERRLDAWGERTQARFHKEGGVPFAEGLVTATITFCVGAMAILGSIQSGLHHNYQLLFIKAALDGFFAMMLATKFGLGVALSAVPVLIYQGAITLGAGFLAPLLTDDIMTEVSAVGGVLIVGIGFNLLNIKKIHVGDMLPAVLIPPLYLLLAQLF